MNDQQLRQWLQKVFGVMPKDLNKYKVALTMRQYEVLELLGDSILGFIVSEYLVTKYFMLWMNQDGLMTLDLNW